MTNKQKFIYRILLIIVRHLAAGEDYEFRRNIESLMTDIKLEPAHDPCSDNRAATSTE